MSAINSQGSKLYHSPSLSPSAFAKVEHVTTITGPDGTAALIDASDLESSAKEYLQGLRDSGQIQCDANFNGATQQMDLKRMFDASADPESFRIQIPTDSTRALFHTFDFLAIVMKWGTSVAVDNKAKLTFTLQTSGGVTYIGSQASSG